MLIFVVEVILILHAGSVSCQKSVSVTTPLGEIIGQEIEYNGEKLYTFHAVPYAENPQRFEKPKPVKPWTTPKNAVSPGKLCMQSIPEYMAQELTDNDLSEDCLHIDIYVPKILSVSNKKAVYIVFPSTENFQTVQAFNEQIKFLTLYTDVLCVMMSYRVNVFGFLSTGDDVISGNYGLWDQKLAIEWVKANIHAFGGDNTRITLSGFAVGGMFASFQASNPSNAGLFKRILIHSTSSNSENAVIKDPNEFAQKLANSVCSNVNFAPPQIFTSQEIFDCLAALPAKDLFDSADKLLTSQEQFFKYLVGPVVDNDFINETTALFGLNYINSVDILVFVVDNEGFIELKPFIPEIESTYNIDAEQLIPHVTICETFAGKIINDFHGTNDKAVEVKNLICNEYKKEDPVEQSRDTQRLLGDYFHYAPLIKMLKLHSNLNGHKNRYMGHFSLVGPFPSEFVEFTWKEGTVSGMTTFYLSLKELSTDFGIPLSNEDDSLVTLMLNYLGSFVKTGDPNNFDSVETKWPVYDINDQYFLHFAKNYSLFVESHLYDQRMKFWLETVSSYLSSPVNTTQPEETTGDESGIESTQTMTTLSDSVTANILNFVTTDFTNKATRLHFEVQFLYICVSIVNFFVIMVI